MKAGTMKIVKALLSGSFLFSCYTCKGQEKLTICYIGRRYETTKNKSFINEKLMFLQNNDSLFVNVKLPYEPVNHQIIDRGIYYNCHLKEDTIYPITLKKICTDKINDAPNSYYLSNSVPDKGDCSRFTEFGKNTAYKYEGNYGKYVDIKGSLYEIIKLTPSDGCVFPP